MSRRIYSQHIGDQELKGISASPNRIIEKQADGTEIELWIRGNIVFHWYEDKNQCTVVHDGRNYSYATLGDDGHLAASANLVGSVDPVELGIQPRILPDEGATTTIIRNQAQGLETIGHHHEEGHDHGPQGAQGAAGAQGAQGAGSSGPQGIAAIGNVRNLVILLRFSNHTGRALQTQAQWNTIFNQVGGDPTLAPSGSVRDVYFENSYGGLTIQSTVVGWIDLPETEQFYANNNSGRDQTIWQAITSGLVGADPLVDFSQFDQDNDGFIDAITFIHSGFAAENGGTDEDGSTSAQRIWSHKWNIPTWTSGEGTRVSAYNINPGLWGLSGSNPGRIGVISHELGHYFGLPDLYDTDGSSEGIGNWGLMAGGSWGFDGSQQYPSHMSAWSKIELGWVTPTTIIAGGTYQVPRVEDNPTIFKISNGYPSGEYLLIENKQAFGFDQKIPQSGLAIWHIDESKGNNQDEGFPAQNGWPANNNHYKVALLQADGAYELELNFGRGNGGDIYHGGGVDELGPLTTPSTDAYQGGNIAATANRIFNISASSATMSFDFNTSDFAEIGVTGNGLEIVSGDVTPRAADGTDFGTLNVPSGSATNSFVITNAGNMDLTITSATISGAAAADYAIITQPATTVAAASATTVEIVFDPSVAGTRAATVSIANNDDNENPYTFNIQGEGVLPKEIAVLGNGVEILDGDLTPSTLDDTDFGDVDVLTETVSKTYTITNSGNAALSVTLPVQISGTHAADFTVTSVPATNVAAAGFTTFTVRFDPSAIGVRDAVVSVTNDDPDENPYDFAIVGTSVAKPEIAILGNGQTIVSGDVTPSATDATDYGAADILTGSTSRTYTITNSGSADLNLSLPVVVSGAQTAEFLVSTIPVTPIAAGGSATFSVTFDPNAAGVRSATLTIASDDDDEAFYAFAIEGTGTVRPNIGVFGNGVFIANGDVTPTPTDHTDFGTVTVPSGSVTRTFTITNGGSSALTLTQVPTIAGAAAVDFSLSGSPSLSIPSLSASTFSVLFDPSAAGARRSSITILSDDPDNGTYTFDVSGSATDPEIVVGGNGVVIADGSTTPLLADHTDFGSLDLLAGSLSRTFTITNEGTADLTISQPTISGLAASEFALITQLVSPVVPGGITTFEISFDPSGTGARDATVSIVNDDADENPYNFDIRGTGTTEPEVALFGNEVLIVDGDATPSTNDFTYFGSAHAGVETVERLYVITNSGSADLTVISPLVFSGVAAGDFSVVAPPTNNVVSGGTASFILRFSPSALGARTATVSIANSDADENPYEFDVGGVGAQPDISVLGFGLEIPDGDAVPAVLDGTDFGTLDAASDPVTNTFAIVNFGDADLVFNGAVSIGGAAAADFTVVQEPVSPVAPGANTSVRIAFDPSVIGLRQATVSINNNDADETPYDFAIQGVSVGPEMVLAGNGTEIVDGDTTPASADFTDFGATDVLVGAVTRTFVITNLGTADLTLSSPVISGAAAADFALASVPSTVITAGGASSFQVTFDPSAEGVRNATISIGNNDADENPYDFNITAMGTTAPEIGVSGNGVNILDGDTTPSFSDLTDFGGALAGGTPVDRVFTITNGGSAALNVSLPVGITGFAAGDFSLISAPSGSVAPGGVTSFTVRFAPTAIGTRPAQLVIVNSDADENPFEFDIVGNGTEPEIAVFGSGVVIADGSLIPSVVNNTDFGSTEVAAGSTTRTYLITNSGSTDLTLTLPISFTGPHRGDFAMVGAPATFIPVGMSSPFTIRFDPSSNGVRSATLQLVNSDADENPYDFAVSGVGTGPDIAVQGAGRDIVDGSLTTSTTNLTHFGTTNVTGGRITNTFVITNTEIGLLVLTLPITIEGDDTNDFSVVTQPGTNTLVTGDSTTFDVVFDPVAGGLREAVVNLVNADSDENPFDFAISGLGDGPEIAIYGNNTQITNGAAQPNSADQTAFGTADLNAGAITRTFVITNEGTLPLIVVNPVLITGTAAAEFAVVTPPTNSIDPGEVGTFSVRFDPAQQGVRSATITVVSGDADESFFSFAVNGTGFVIPPILTAHPVGQTLNALESTTLSASAIGTAPLSFQWFRNGVLLPGATGNLLPLNSITTGQAGDYHVTVSNVAGVATSASARITVNLLSPGVSWANPDPITYGTALGPVQLNATATVPGSFAYTPDTGTVLDAGLHQLAGVFTPSNPLVYSGANVSVPIVVNKANLTLTANDANRLVNTPNPAFTFAATGLVNGDDTGSLLTQPTLDTTATGSGETTSQNYPITITGATHANYNVTHVEGTLLVFLAEPVILEQPVSVSANALETAVFAVTAVGEATLTYQWYKDGVAIPDATSAVLTLNSVTRADEATYTVRVTNGSGDVLSSGAALAVQLLDPVVTWLTPDAIRYGTPISGVQLNAAANISGQFNYNPATAAVLDALTHTLNVTFVPDDANYNQAVASVNLVVTNAPLTITANDATREYGLADPAFGFTFAGFVNGDDERELAVQPSASTPAVVNSLPGDYPINVSSAAGPNYDITMLPGTLTVFANAPTISDQPDALAIVEGGDAAFAVIAGGTSPLSYQWRHTGTNLPGATLATLNLNSAIEAQSGPYEVLVSNVGGSITSAVANLTVLVPPTITSQPLAQDKLATDTANISVSAIGTAPLFFQWRKDGVDLPEQTNSLLQLGNLSTSDVADYRVVVTNSAGAVTSSIAAVSITLLTANLTWPNPAAINYGVSLSDTQLNASANIPGSFTYTPAAGTILAGGNHTLDVLFTPQDPSRFSVQGLSRPLTVLAVPLTVTAQNASKLLGSPNPTFLLSYDGFVLGQNAANLATAPTVGTAANDSSPLGTYALIPGGGVSPNYTFNYVHGTLIISAVPLSITAQPTDLIVTQAQTATFTVVAAGTGPQYQWRKDGTNIDGATSATLTIADAQAIDDASYDVVVTNSANAVTSSVVALDVMIPTTITWAQPADVVYGTQLGSAQQNASPSIAGTLTYGQATGSVLPVGTHSLTVDFAPADPATYLATNATVDLTVTAAPLTISADPKVREFGAANPTLSASFAGFVNGEGPANLATQPILATVADGNSLPGSYPITVTGVTSPNYAITPVDGSLTVFANQPVINSTPNSQTVTNGDPVTLIATASGTAPLHYQWRLNGGDVSGANATFLTIAAVSLADAGTYELVVSNVAGSVTSQSAALTVLDPPAITVQPVEQQFALGGSATFSVTATGTAPLGYQWSKNGVPISGATAATYDLNNIVVSDIGVYSVVINNVAGTVTSQTATLSANEFAPDITWNTPVPITYGTALSGFELNASTFVPGTFTYTPAAGTILHGGTHNLSVLFEPTDTTNFVATNGTVTLTVNAAPLTAKADDVLREFGKTNEPLSFTYTGFVNGDSAASLDSQPILSTVADTNSVPGNYPITINGAAGTNYAVTHTPGVFTVFADAPTVVTPPTNGVTIDGLGAAFFVGVAGTAPISYQWRHAGTNLPGAITDTLAIPVATASASAGAYDVVLSNIAGTVTSVVANLTVLVPPVITQQPTDVAEGALTTALLSVGASGTAPLSYIWRKDGVIQVGQSRADLVFTNATTNLSGSYSVIVSNAAGTATSAPVSLTIIQRSSIISWADPAAITYGTPLTTNQLNASTANAGTFVYTPALGTVLATGTTNLTVAFTPDDDSNYMPANRSVPLQVLPAPLTVTADDKIREFGLPNPALTVTYSGFVNGEDSSVLDSSPTVSTLADTNSGLGDYAITVSGAADANYSVTHVPGNLNVFGRAPLIISHPLSQAAVAGSNVSFTNITIGTAPLHYQWRRESGLIAGATNTVFTITNVHPLDAGAYDVVISNVAGTAVSFPLLLDVLVPPSFSESPVNTTISVGQPTTLVSKAVGTTPITYQWYRDGAVVVNETNASISLAAPAGGDAGVYEVVASNQVGMTTNAPATLTVLPTPSITQLPQNTTVNAGSPIVIDAQAYGQGALTYTWRRGSSIVLAGINETRLLIPNAAVAHVGIYDLTVSNSFGVARSQEFLVTLSGRPQIMVHPVSQTVLSNDVVTFAVIANGSQPLQYSWLKIGDPDAVGASRTLTLTNVLADSGEYLVAVVNEDGIALSDPAKLAVIQPPVILSNPSNQVAAVGSTARLIVEVDSAVTPDYQWRFNGQVLANATNATLTLPNIQLIQSGSYDVIATNITGGITSAPAAVSVLIPPTFTLSPRSQTVPLGTNVQLSGVAAGSSPLGFQWFRDGALIPGATNNLYSLTNVSRLVEGAYALRISNPVGTLVSPNALVRVISPQRLTNGLLSQGGSFTLFFGDDDGTSLTLAHAQRFVVEASSDMRTWHVAATNGSGIEFSNGQFRFVDPNPASTNRRFYRIREY